ncbi:serine hydrolase domain-containing protein [Robertkochia flava]|uniref:serine hydrolase domain-containing protein n=1 Tax=Robertkochia flava TaxID=3447986 RepID=UPI001CCCCF50|nr:serine hydrolase [Robertkochia marina]
MLTCCSTELTPPVSDNEPETVVNDTVPPSAEEEDPPQGGDEGSGDDPDPGTGEGNDNGDSKEIQMFFPSNEEPEAPWNTLEADSLGWDTSVTEALYSFLDVHDTRAFLLLYRGHIVLERYSGQEYETNTAFEQQSFWYWASAGKTLTSFLTGLAQEKGLLDISDRTSDYLGDSWSSLSPDKQDLIQIRHHLNMTTGLDEKITDNTPNDRVDDDCTEPECLQYKADAGTRWSYHNAPYNLLDEILMNATGNRYEDFSNTQLEYPLGMRGEWRVEEEYNTIYWSTARDAARFGLLMLNEGVWKDSRIMNDEVYFNAMIGSSQDINPAYGYLWWLNREGLKIPGSGGASADFFTPNAPPGMYTAAGLNGQFIDVVPELELVVVRFGELNNVNERALHHEMWGYLKDLIQY